MPNERLRRTESSISIVNQQKNEEILSYLKETDSDLRKKKKQLNEQITKAYKENNINTKQGRKTLRDLHNVWYHLTVKNELKAIFGFDVIDFYSKKFEYTDEIYRKNYVNMMLKIEDIMKKEGNTESKHTKNLTKKEKEELHTLYKGINHVFAEGSLFYYSASPSATLIDKKIQDFLENGILAHFEKYDYYDLNKSKTLSRLGLNKWNIKYLLDRSSKDQLVQEGSKTLEQELYEKSEEELKERKKDLHSSIMKENKADKKQINTDELKNNLRQFFEVRHQLFVRQVINEAVDIDVEKFCQKYVSRIWIDPKQQASLFQAEVSTILKADKKKMNAEEEHELKKESIRLKKNIHSIYKKIKKLDQKKEWTEVHTQTHKMIDEINQLVKINAAINTQGYDYYSVENDKTLIDLSIYVNECRLEDTQIRSEQPMNDRSRVEEEISSKSDLKNPQMDAHSTAEKIESDQQNQLFVMKTEKAVEKAKQQENVVSSKEQQQPANEQLNEQLSIADNDSDKLIQEGSKTLEQELYEKSEEELKERKKDLHSSIMKENKADKKQINTDELKNNLRQFFEVRHQLFVRQVINEASDIDVEKFCQKYVSRVWIDPKQQASLFQAEVSTILKADKKKMNAEEEHKLKKESIRLKKNIHSIYKKIKKLDQKKEWTEVHDQTHKMIDEINQLVKINAAINAQGYDYYSVENDKTLIDLSIYVNECRLEDTQIRSEQPMNDRSRVEEETSSKSDLKNPQMDAHSTAEKIESDQQNQSFVMKTEKAVEKAKQQENVVSSKEQQQQPANEQLNEQLFIADNDSARQAIADLKAVEAINHEIITKEFLVKQEETGEKADNIQISEKKKPTPRSNPKEADNRIPHDSEPIYAEITWGQNHVGSKSSLKAKEPQHLKIETVAQVHREVEADNRILHDGEPIYAEIIRDKNQVGSKFSPKAKAKEPQHLITETEAQVHRDNRSEASYAQITRKPYWYKLTPQQTEYTSELRARLAEKNNSNPGTFENRIAESKQGSRNANALKSPSQHNSHENGISMA